MAGSLDTCEPSFDISDMAQTGVYLPDGATVPMAFVRVFYDYLDQHWAEMNGSIAARRPARSCDPMQPYPARFFCALLDDASHALGDPQLGFHIGQTMETNYLGALGYVLASSDSIQDAMERLMRFHRLVHDVNEMRLSVRSGHFVIEWTDTRGRFGRHFDEMGIAAFVRCYRDLHGDQAVIPRIDFINPQPPNIGPYLAYFGEGVRFDQPTTGVHIPIEYLSLPFKTSDPVLKELLEQQVSQSLSDLAEDRAIDRRIKRIIARTVCSGLPSLDQVAEALRLSPRQLRDELRRQGFSFRTLSRDALKSLAEVHLANRHLSVQQVSQLLGYSEQSAFCRAYKGWTGHSPSAFRQMVIADKATKPPSHHRA